MSSAMEKGSVEQARKASVDHVEKKATVETTALAADTVGLDDDLLLRMSAAIPNFADTIAAASRASAAEHKLSAWDALRLYPYAIIFSFILSLAIVMEGYDTALLGSFWGFPEFREQFGVRLPDGSYQVTSRWQSALGCGSTVGEILGLMIAGKAAERFGYRKTMLGSLFMMICFIFLFFFAKNIQMLLAAEILAGLPWGAFQTLTTTYAAEVSPVIMRPYLTTYVNLCWATGQFISTGVLRGLLSRTDEWGWRIPYAIQWIWPVPIIVGVFLAPESPWWLVRKGETEKARQTLLRLTSRSRADFDYDVDDAVSLMVVTNVQEKLVVEGVSYWDCFKGTNLRRTEIASFVWACQTTCGIGYASSVTYFLEQVGFPAEKSFDFGLGLNGLAWLGTVGSWFVMRYVGRRKLFNYGLTVMLLILLIVGFLAIPSHGAASLYYASASILLVYNFVYGITVGPVVYCLVAEIPSTRLRIKTAVLARNFYNITVIGFNFLNPPILNPTAWDLKGKGGFIWGAFCLVSLVWAYFRLPEPLGLTPAELDVLFEQKVSARKFSKVKADPFRSANFGVARQNDAADGEDA